MTTCAFAMRKYAVKCEARVCVEMCSGQAIAPDTDGLPTFDREKCVHCGACLWNCTEIDEDGQANLVFAAGAGGLHRRELTKALAARMAQAGSEVKPLHIVVCGSVVPDPLQTLEPVTGPAGPALKNETLLPAVFDPWAAHALYEAAHLAKHCEGSRVWLVSLGPRVKLQQVMMSLAQKAAFEPVFLDGPAHGFADSHQTAAVLADAVAAIPGLDRSRLLLFGGCESASRGQGVTLQMVGERLGIIDQFQSVDRIVPSGRRLV